MVAQNLGQLIPAIFTGPNGERLTPDQIKRRQEIAKTLLQQATDTSPNAGGWTSVLAKGVQGFASGWNERKGERAAEANAKASQANISGLLSGALGSDIGGSVAPVGQGATVAQPMVSSGAGNGDIIGTAPITPVDISGNKQEFVNALLPAAIEEGRRTGVDPRIIVAQAAQETGWGRSAPGNNYFGIKSHGQGGGNSLMTTEYVDGQKVNVRDSFRAFENPADSVRGYGDFILQNPRYKPLREAQGIDAQLAALQASGYATDPNYSRSVGAIAKGIQMPNMATPDAAGIPMSPAAMNANANAGLPPVNEAVPMPPMTPAVQPAAQTVAAPMPAAPVAAPVQMAQAMPPINPKIIETLSNPYASDQEKAVAQSLIGDYMGKKEAMQKRQIELQQRQQEIARRQALAPSVGIDPVYASDDKLWDAATGNVFAAPSTSTINDVVIDNRTGKPIYEAPPQNYRQVYGQEAAAMGLDPNKAYNIGPNGEVKPIGDGGVTVNNNMGGDKFGEEFAKLDAQAVSTVATAGLAAQRNLGRIDQLEGLLNQSPSGAQAALTQAAGEWGIPIEGLDNLQAAQAVINTLIPEQRPPGSGPMSDRDIELFKQGLPRVINQPGGNQIIINTMRGIAQYDAKGAEIVQRLRDGRISRAEAFQELQSRPNPLASFKAPAAQGENPLPTQTGSGKRMKFTSSGELVE